MPASAKPSTGIAATSGPDPVPAQASLAGADVLVTGGAGFIGSHLVRRLIAGGATVRVLEHPTASTARIERLADRFTLVRTDFSEAAPTLQAIAALQPAVVFHLAGWTGGRGLGGDLEAWRRSFRVNLDGALNLIAALEPHVKLIRRIVRVGSMEEYGDGPVPFREEQRERAVSPYSASVVAATQAAHPLAARLELPLVTVRPSIVYGPGQEPSFFIPGLIRACLAGEDFKMTRGEQAGDFVFVEDLVDALIGAAIAERAVGEIVNAGTGRAVKVRDLAERIVRLSGSETKLEIGAMPSRDGEASRRFMDQSKASDVLGWTAATDLDEGLLKTIAWYRAGQPALSV